jgi:hypothetical protein
VKNARLKQMGRLWYEALSVGQTFLFMLGANSLIEIAYKLG